MSRRGFGLVALLLLVVVVAEATAVSKHSKRAAAKARQNFQSCQRNLAPLMVQLAPGDAKFVFNTCTMTSQYIFQALTGDEIRQEKLQAADNEPAFALLESIAAKELTEAAAAKQPSIMYFNFAVVLADMPVYGHSFSVFCFPGSPTPFRLVQSFVTSYTYFDWLGDKELADEWKAKFPGLADYTDACKHPTVNVEKFKPICEQFSRNFVALPVMQSFIRQLAAGGRKLGHGQPVDVPGFFDAAQALFGVKEQELLPPMFLNPLLKSKTAPIFHVDFKRLPITSDTCADVLQNFEKVNKLDLSQEISDTDAAPSAATPTAPTTPTPQAAPEPLPEKKKKNLVKWLKNKAGVCARKAKTPPPRTF